MTPKHKNNPTTTGDPRFAKLHFDPRFKPIQKKKFKADARFQELYQKDSASFRETKKRKWDQYGRPTSVQLKKRSRWEDVFEKQDEEESEASEDGVESDASMLSDISLSDLPVGIQPGRKQEVGGDILLETVLDQRQIPLGEPTHRLAVLNLDWDHLRPIHLLKLMDSVKPPGGQILSVKQFRSEFGKERMAYEEKYGPKYEQAKQIYSSKSMNEEVEEEAMEKEMEMEEKEKEEDLDFDENEDEDEDGDDEDEENEKNYNEALRKYELEKLRYYYMVVTCDSVNTAKTIVKECDGVEFEKSSNVLDLRYVPEDMEFEEPPVDEAHQLPIDYVPIQFQTNVFQHTKVKSTWEEDVERPLLTRKIKSQSELDEMDYAAYIASSSSEAEVDDVDEEAGKREEKGVENRRKRKDVEKYRALLGLGPPTKTTETTEENEGGGSEEEKAEEEQVTGDMEMTFSLDLSETARSLLEERETKLKRESESTLDTYQRKMKERKQRKLEGMHPSADEVSSEESTEEVERGGNEEREEEDEEEGAEEEEEEDPFFTTTPTPTPTPTLTPTSTPRKSKKKQRLERNLEKKRQEVLDREDPLDVPMNLEDPRFQSLFEDHEYAIDPSHPQFKDSENMQKVLFAKRNKHHKHHSSSRVKGEDPSKKKDPNVLELAQALKIKSNRFMRSMEKGWGRRKRCDENTPSSFS